MRTASDECGAALTQSRRSTQISHSFVPAITLNLKSDVLRPIMSDRAASQGNGDASRLTNAEPQPQGRATRGLNKDALSPPDQSHANNNSSSSSSNNTPRRGSLDTRSLRAPSMLSTNAVPSRLSASPSTTSALSASPNSFNIGRSPSGGVYDSQGGAAARLRRVASNVSIAGSLLRLKPQKQEQADTTQTTHPATSSNAGGLQRVEQQATTTDHSSVSGEFSKDRPTDPAAEVPIRRTGTKKRKSTKAQDPEPMDESALVSASSDQPLVGHTEASSSSASSRPAVQTISTEREASKDSNPKSQPSTLRLHPEKTTRPSSRRRTWYGWNATTADKEEPAITSKDGMDIDREEVESSEGPVDTSHGQNGSAIAKEQDQDQGTLKPSVDPLAQRLPGSRSSWFGWSGQNQTLDFGKGLPTGGGTAQLSEFAADTNLNEGEETIRQRTAKEVKDADTGTVKASNPRVEGSDTNARQPSWVWRLWSNTPVDTDTQMAQDESRAQGPNGDTVVEDQSREDVAADTSMGQSDPSYSSVSASGWSRWIPYWSHPGAQTTTGATAQEQSLEQPPLTPAEQVKADALARPDPSNHASPLPSLDATNAVLNGATRESWISYFSSRKARPVAQIASNEPEVMEIDFEDESTTASQPTPAKTTSTTNPATVPQKLLGKTSKGLEGSTSAQSSRPSTPSLAVGRSPKPDPAPVADRPSTPLTGSKNSAVEAAKKATKKPASIRPPVPNLVLPTFEDTFSKPPRSLSPPAGVLKRTLTAVNTWLSGPSETARMRTAPRINKGAGASSSDFGMALAEEAAVRLPRSWDTMGQRAKADKRGCDGKIRRIVTIGIHGWFAQSWASKWMGEPTGTSGKFATATRDAVLRHFKSVDGMELNPEAVTMIPLSADGTVSVRVDRSFAALLSRKEWMQDLAEADAIFFTCHSQGCIVGTTLLARLIEQKLIDPRRTRLAVLAMCGVHAGPFEHLRTTVVSSYLNYFETAAAKELFEFQHSKTAVSKQYEHALRIVLDAGTKLTLVASTDDQVVPLHSALFTSATHPSILRALYIHGATFPKLDFLTNMLTFCVGVRNAGLSDHNLLALLSASVAGSLYGGLGHSLCYDEEETYNLAVQYLFQSTHPLSEPTTRSDEQKPPSLQMEAFETRKLNNPHLLPWSLRGILEDRAVRATFAKEINKLLSDFETWRPATKTLKDVQYRLEPMRSVPRPTEEAEASQQQLSRKPSISPSPSASKL